MESTLSSIRVVGSPSKLRRLRSKPRMKPSSHGRSPATSRSLRHPSMDGIPNRPTARNGGDLLLVGSRMIAVRSRHGQAGGWYPLGDAAHAMLPHLGQGANQAIEDGVALALLLEGRDPDEVPDFAEYEKFRCARTDVIQAEARKTGLRYDPGTRARMSAIAKSPFRGVPKIAL